MGVFTQVGRLYRFIPPTNAFAEDDLMLWKLRGFEEMSRPFEYVIDLLSELTDRVMPADVIGENATVHFTRPDGGEEFINGHLTHLRMMGRKGSLRHYQVVMRPWFSLLSFRQNCRIFHKKKVAQIVQQVVQEHGFDAFLDASMLNLGNYPEHEYIVQYRESDFAFLSRLMEMDGIAYHFEHALSGTSNGSHKMVLSDPESIHLMVDPDEPIPFIQHPDPETEEVPAGSVPRLPTGHFWQWRAEDQFEPDTYVLDDFDWKKPNVDLVTAGVSTAIDHQHNDLESYDYPGGFSEPGDGTKLTEKLMELHKCRAERFKGRTDSHALRPGLEFEIQNDPILAAGTSYYCIRRNLFVQSDLFESSTAMEEAESDLAFFATIEAIEGTRSFRPEKSTPAPIIAGVHSAIVVGNSAIDVDEFGRVLVKFHWARDSNPDSQISMRVRVSQFWAGKNWGAMHIPHKDHEVLVAFEEGDPDRPVIVGRVYNEREKVPRALPANKTISIWSDVGGNFLAFDQGNYIHLFTPNQNTTICMGVTTQTSIVVTGAFGLSIAADGINMKTDLCWLVQVGSSVCFDFNADWSVDVAAAVNFEFHSTVTGHIVGVTQITIDAATTINIGANTQVNITAGNLGIDVQAGTHTLHVAQAVIFNFDTTWNVHSIGAVTWTFDADLTVTLGGSYTGATLGEKKSWTTGAEMKGHGGLKGSFVLGMKLDINVAAETKITTPLAYTLILGAKVDKIIGMKSDTTIGLRKEITAGPKRSVHLGTKDEKALTFAWKGVLAKIGTVLKVIG